MSIREELLSLRDGKNAAFMAKLIPGVPAETVLGARMPALRKLAGQLKNSPEAAAFLDALPHALFDENLLHALLLNELRGFNESLAALARFLPHVDNWAVCDALRPKSFARNREALRRAIPGWLGDERPFIRRFGLEMLMVHFLDGDFSPEIPELAVATRGEDYYVRMMQAWFFATALAKQYGAALPVLTERRLEPWTHNRTIQKAIESYRLSDEQKAYLKTLRIK